MMETVCENILHVYLSAFLPLKKGVSRKSESIPVQIPRLKFTFHACFMHVLLALRDTYNQCYGSGSVCFWASRIRHYFVRIRILPSTSQNSKKNLDFYYFVTSLDFLPMKTDVNALSKRNKHKKHVWQQCCGSGSTGSTCFWASWIRIH